MKKYLILYSIFALVSLISLSGSAQNKLRLRIGGNATRFLKEPQGVEKNFWEIDTLNAHFGPFMDFVNKFKLGGEAELMMSLSDKTWFGLEVSMDKLYGENSHPGLYNFQYTDYLQLHTTDTINEIVTTHLTNYPIKYSTRLINLIANFRIYPFPEGRFHPFIKVSAGLSLVSTELALLTPSTWTDSIRIHYPNIVPGPPVLYSRGTTGSGKGLLPAFTFGGGIGFEFRINDKLSAYADASLRIVNSDIVDGKPNFDWFIESGKLEHFNTRSNIAKISFGIVYTISENFAGINLGRSSGGKGWKRGGKQHPYLPFYEIKGY